MSETLLSLVSAELIAPTDPRAAAMAGALAANIGRRRARCYFVVPVCGKPVLMDFARLNNMATDNVSVWARFAQPSRLPWAAADTTSLDEKPAPTALAKQVRRPSI